ncbi:DEAD/DEAH box helicase family protein [Ruminococcus sp.]|uniref:DEAD/DEAH box helicase n=1 Tax=Ruminococcus sp. TaxID=41978 RepID=UPI002600E595|nr:DEAD/DEAH box helicase family protein [Ruminococcus sp.]
MVNGIENYEFQEKCVDFLCDKTTSIGTKQVVTVKAPTGAGKTVILVKYVDTYLKNTDGKTAFIWLCPGSGDLEEQSKERMEDLSPQIDTRSLPYSMLCGFEGRSVTFINWELVNRKKNNALKDGERKNLFEKIEEAHQDGIRFIIIIDEEHKNADTAASREIIEAFKAEHIIRVSATPNKVSHQEFYEIPEEEVIEAGLITRAIYVNEGVEDSERIEDDYDILLKLADDKRIEIWNAYQQINVDIRPLVLIQFPVGQPETIKLVEAKLESMGYTYGNGMVNIWMSDKDQKIISEDLTAPNGSPAFLLMKQAVATGWDCPRAKILVKLREGGSERFQIQTIGRIRRMPERKHYLFPGVLDFCFIYTLDTEYKNDLLTQLDKAYQVRRLFAKPEVRDFSLTKEMRNLDIDSGIGEREMLRKVYEHFKDKYQLGSKMADNQLALESADYSFSHEIDSRILHGEFRTTDDLSNASAAKKVSIKTKINTHSHGIYLMHSVDEIKKITSIPAQKVKNILQRLFRKGKKTKFKFISLDTSDFYAFIINNIKLLKQDFREIMAQESGKQLSFAGQAKTSTFTIPESELYKFSMVKKIKPMTKNAYAGYTNEFVTSETRKSTPERLFEQFCERCNAIEWVYKNGDAGQQYFSIVYQDGFSGKQWLFYPDYIVKLSNGEVWIIETKGGMQGGFTKNIDIQVENKFKAFKDYAQRYNVMWGFVRDIDEELYLCNTEYTEEMTGDNWLQLESVLK